MNNTRENSPWLVVFNDVASGEAVPVVKGLSGSDSFAGAGKAVLVKVIAPGEAVPVGMGISGSDVVTGIGEAIPVVVMASREVVSVAGEGVGLAPPEPAYYAERQEYIL